MTRQPPQSHADLDRLRNIAHRMDTALRIPLIGVRVGWDSILGLVPGVGDALALVPAGYIVKEAHRLGASRRILGQMCANVGIDLAIGAIPLVGDLFDVGWKANTRNVDLLHEHLSDRDRAAAARQPEGALSSHHPTLGG